MKELIQISPSRLNKSDMYFVKFLSSVNNAITCDDIVNYYVKNVRRHSQKWDYYMGNWRLITYTKNENKIVALAWFDRKLGKFLRMKILSEQGNNKLLNINY